jgi:hypothetical protein
MFYIYLCMRDMGDKKIGRGQNTDDLPQNKGGLW